METLYRADYFETDKAVSILPRTPQPEFPEHEHEFHELVLVSSGSAMHYIDGRPYMAGKGSVFYIAAGHAHYFDEVEALNLTNVVFSPGDLQTSSLLSFLPESAATGSLRIGGGVLSYCENLFSAIAKECCKQDPCASSMAETLFTQLIVMLWREEQGIREAQGTGDDKTLALIRHIDLHYGEDIDISELAAHFGIPMRTMTRRMLDATGLSPSNYLARVRLCSAMRMLRQSDLSITDIAFNCGFNDSNYFSSRFHHEIGVTPKQYRQSFQPNLGQAANPVIKLAVNTR
jgi:AraC family transcriptional regulator, L-rhamnose operon regulatory protein RhaS